jgi:DNA-binding transcriptional MocR family regulator
LFDQHAKLEQDLDILIEKFQIECTDNLHGPEREQLKAILETLVSKNAQEELLKNQETLDLPEVREVIQRKLEEIGVDAEVLSQT